MSLDSKYCKIMAKTRSCRFHKCLAREAEAGLSHKKLVVGRRNASRMSAWQFVENKFETVVVEQEAFCGRDTHRNVTVMGLRFLRLLYRSRYLEQKT